MDLTSAHNMGAIVIANSRGVGLSQGRPKRRHSSATGCVDRATDR
jgi:hypothetical protein